MLSRLAGRITRHFINKGAISEDESEVYDYCFEVLLSTALNLAAIVVVAALTRAYIESLLFSAGFMALRGSAGGYHAGSHVNCFLSLMVYYCIMLVGKIYIPSTCYLYFIVAFAVVAAVLIVILAPIDCANKPLDEEERALQRKKSLTAISILLAIVVPLAVFSVTRVFAFALSYSAFCVSTLLAFGKVSNLRLSKKHFSGVIDYFESAGTEILRENFQ